ncbi:MAG: pyridoxal-dependent aspartate 1-decarboxylase PanP [Gammaproteobacteria bacterium]
MEESLIPNIEERAEVNQQNLDRIFTIPESSGATLARIEKEISTNLDGFLREHIVAEEKPMGEIEADFSSVEITDRPFFVSAYTDFILKNLVAQSVHISAPSFIGHMSSALPYFMLPLSKIVTALNQNMVKVETSKAFTPMERQVLGMLHRLVYEQKDSFYKQWLHNFDHALGAFCSGGTIANITALWVARNNILNEKIISSQGLYAAVQDANVKGLAVLVSSRGHYSLLKAMDVLGLGRDNMIMIETDKNHKVNVQAMRKKALELQAEGIEILSLVGIAGATETGSVDSLDEIADLSKELKCHFHVDAAWGGPTLFSEKYKHLLKGIEQADSVTIDAHKQFYVPMGAGMVLFKDPKSMQSIQLHAEYIIRRGSRDLGQQSLEGSRPGMALLVHAGLNIIGRKGYEMLIDQGIEKANYFAEIIDQHDDFELLIHPELNIMGYRYAPKWIQECLGKTDNKTMIWINEKLDYINKNIQKTQRSEGKSFVSRTRVGLAKYNNTEIIYFRIILANPLTKKQDLLTIVDHQLELVKHDVAQNALKEIQQYCYPL